MRRDARKDAADLPDTPSEMFFEAALDRWNRVESPDDFWPSGATIFAIEVRDQRVAGGPICLTGRAQAASMDVGMP